MAHRNLIWLLLSAYLLGAFAPGAGIWIRQVELEDGVVGLSLLKALLALLLFNAGLGVDPNRLPRTIGQLARPTGALGASILVSLAFVLAVGLAIRPWAPSEMVFAVLMGTALVAAMPVAGSSMAWSQNADGNLSLSLEMLLGSTLISPLSASLVLACASAVLPMSTEWGWDWSIFSGVAPFLLLWVILPSICGVATRALAGAERIERIKVYLKLTNMINLLVLNYSNASLCLPQMFDNPSGPLLGLIGIATVGLCLTMVVSAAVTARLMGPLMGIQEARHEKTEGPPERQADRIALMLAFAMRNNGVALVLASSVLPGHGELLLSIIAYNLIQHLAAATIDRLSLSRV